MQSVAWVLSSAWKRSGTILAERERMD